LFAMFRLLMSEVVGILVTRFLSEIGICRNIGKTYQFLCVIILVFLTYLCVSILMVVHLGRLRIHLLGGNLHHSCMLIYSQGSVYCYPRVKLHTVFVVHLTRAFVTFLYVAKPLRLSHSNFALSTHYPVHK
jgi:hypothetical protein